MASERSRRGWASLAKALLLATGLGGCVADVGVPGETNAPNPKWEKEAAGLEGPRVYDRSTPWMGADQASTHVPDVVIEGDGVTVSVPYAISSEHYVTHVYLRDQDGVIIALYAYPPPEAGDEQVGLSTQIPLFIPVRAITAYVHCNEHDVWKSDPVLLR